MTKCFSLDKGSCDAILYIFIMLYFRTNNNKGYYGDFAQMIWANTHMVGCGRSRFMVNI